MLKRWIIPDSFTLISAASTTILLYVETWYQGPYNHDQHVINRYTVHSLVSQHRNGSTHSEAKRLSFFSATQQRCTHCILTIARRKHSSTHSEATRLSLLFRNSATGTSSSARQGSELMRRYCHCPGCERTASRSQGGSTTASWQQQREKKDAEHEKTVLERDREVR